MPRNSAKIPLRWLNFGAHTRPCWVCHKGLCASPLQQHMLAHLFISLHFDKRTLCPTHYEMAYGTEKPHP
jgi:hypothetical protein